MKSMNEFTSYIRTCDDDTLVILAQECTAAIQTGKFAEDTICYDCLTTIVQNEDRQLSFLILTLDICQSVSFEFMKRFMYKLNYKS